jgi:hypothetical protein
LGAKREPLGGGAYELLQNLSFAPGRYQLRIGVLAGGSAAGVYTDLDVPDFSRGKPASSGVTLSVSPALPHGPVDALRDLMPIVPTAQRRFATTDQVTAFLRVYSRNPGAQGVEASATSEIIDGAGRAVFTNQTALRPVTVGALTGLDYVVTMPAAMLAPGRYVLKVRIKATEVTLSEAVIFEIVSASVTELAVTERATAFR